jgi:hypothetical protein
MNDVRAFTLNKTNRLNQYFTTRKLDLLNLPTTFPDLFEFMAACDLDFEHNFDSTLWTFLKNLNVKDLIILK